MMLRARSLKSSVLATGLFVASFTACGGSADSLFTAVGGQSSLGGSMNAIAGQTSSGNASSAGGHASNGGGGTLGGNSNGGLSSNGGEATGGSNNAGESAGGVSSGGGSGGNGAGAGRASGGAANGGAAGSASAGSHSGGSGAAGTSSGGTSSGGASSGGASIGGANAAGAGGGTTTPTCSDLLARAEKELTAAQACDDSRDALPCTGRVETTCGCAVPVDRQTSDETQAYLATLKELQTRHCISICPALACLPITRAQCSSKGGAGGTCVAIRGPITE